MINWLKSLLSGKAEQNTPPVQENSDQPQNPNERDHDDPAYQATFDAVLAYWQKIGTVEEDVISYLVNPMFLGAPAWPSGRQAFKVIRTKDSLIIASDGLSDPFSDDKTIQENGFEMEVFIEVEGKQSRKHQGNPLFFGVI